MFWSVNEPNAVVGLFGSCTPFSAQSPVAESVWTLPPNAPSMVSDLLTASTGASNAASAVRMIWLPVMAPSTAVASVS